MTRRYKSFRFIFININKYTFFLGTRRKDVYFLFNKNMKLLRAAFFSLQTQRGQFKKRA